MGRNGAFATMFTEVDLQKTSQEQPVEVPNESSTPMLLLNL